jgi:hypothetical protein
MVHTAEKDYDDESRRIAAQLEAGRERKWPKYLQDGLAALAMMYGGLNAQVYRQLDEERHEPRGM